MSGQEFLVCVGYAIIDKKFIPNLPADHLVLMSIAIELSFTDFHIWLIISFLRLRNNCETVSAQS